MKSVGKSYDEYIRNLYDELNQMHEKDCRRVVNFINEEYLSKSAASSSSLAWPLPDLSSLYKTKETMFTRIRNFFKRKPSWKECVKVRLDQLQNELSMQSTKASNRADLLHATVKKVEIHEAIFSSGRKYYIAQAHELSSFFSYGWKLVKNLDDNTFLLMPGSASPEKKSTSKKKKKR